MMLNRKQLNRKQRSLDPRQLVPKYIRRKKHTHTHTQTCAHLGKEAELESIPSPDMESAGRWSDSNQAPPTSQCGQLQDVSRMALNNGELVRLSSLAVQTHPSKESQSKHVFTSILLMIRGFVYSASSSQTWPDIYIPTCLLSKCVGILFCF